MRIFVTGGAGFIGTRVLKGLLGSGTKIRALLLPGQIPPFISKDLEWVYGDLRALNSDWLSGINTVLHMAGILTAPENPTAFYEINEAGSVTLAEAAQNTQVTRFVLISSISVTYPRLNPYSLSKANAERKVSQIFGKDFCSIRPCLVYGHGGGSEFASFCRHVLKGRVVFLPKKGIVIKRPVHVDDFAEALVRITTMHGPILGTSPNTPYVLGGQVSLTLQQMVARIRQAAGKKPAWIFGTPGLTLLSALPDLFPTIKWPKWFPNQQQFDGLNEDADFDSTDAQRDFGIELPGFLERFTVADLP